MYVRYEENLHSLTMGVHDDSRNLTNSEHVACCATPVKDVINFSIHLLGDYLRRRNYHTWGEDEKN
jgi:hypothetical protein